VKSSDFQSFAQIWASAWEQVGKPITPGAIELAFEALRDHELIDIRRALTVHMRDPQRGRFAPTVADVVAATAAFDASAAWPTPDEAWAICVRTYDEADTAVVFDEIMQAREIAQPVMDLGDEVGARMAFRDAYGRIVGAAKLAGSKPRWWVTQGYNRELRDMRIAEAIRVGRLPRSHGAALLGYDPTGPEQRALSVGNRSTDGLVQLGAIGKPAQTAEDREEQRKEAEARRAAVVERANEALRHVH
jgi:hypothetical protein